MTRTLQTNTDDNTQSYDLDEQPLDDLIAKAVEAAAKGENVEQLLDVMLAALPAKIKEKARKAFAAGLAKRGLRQPSGEADIPSRATLSRIRAALSVTTRQMIDRISRLLRSRPDIASSIQQAGQVLAKNGVRDDKVTVSEAELGTMAAPAVAAAKPQKDQGTGRGA
jgi:hypothetical protein